VDIIIVLGNALWLLFPAMTSNSFAVWGGGGTTMDFGKSWHGKRIFGDGKTWRGFFVGILFGTIVGFAEMLLVDLGLFRYSPTYWGFGTTYIDAAALLIVLCSGALLGDAVKSFIKRRLGMARGQKAPFFDWYDFFIGALLLSFIFYPNWAIDNLITDYHWMGLILLVIFIPFFHIGFNRIGYRLGKKNVPLLRKLGKKDVPW
jgi:CDP-2,3-bis-(O-geranylgeranyl)-sn-glycerol synthase